jgi:granule-bound starch synthase
MNSAIPKGPAGVAAGRSVARGRNAVKMNAAGKPTTSIDKKYQIVFLSSEVAPWSKTGGLGEAMDGLPIALAALGHRVMTISPRYDQYAEGWDTAFESSVPMGPNTEPVRCFHAFQSKVDRVFMDHDCFLAKIQGKSGAMLYGPEWGKDFADNQWRFMYFAKAALKIIKELPLGGYPYGSDCIVVVNDWHCSLFPAYLEVEKRAGEWANTKTAMIIHNAVFQGRFDRDDPEEPSLEIAGLPEEIIKTFTFKMSLKVGRTEKPVARCINWLAGAATYVDKILTVSPTYAWELINLPEMGVNLDELFAKKGVTGIVNGVKEAVNPENESFAMKAKMLSTFGVKDVDVKKAEMKKYLQELYGLPVSPKTPLCIFVGRMDLQKGYDYLLEALTTVLDKVDLQVILIGTGRADLVASTKALAKRHPGKIYIAGWCGPERYAIVAGSDYNLMPSRWEPCGLAQMESMRFGSLPVVAQTGGLVDTVQDMVTGIHIQGAVSVEKELDPSSVQVVAQALETCASVYSDGDKISQMRKAAMAAGAEYTWSNAALQYEAVFDELGAVDILPRCKDKEVTLEVDKVVA